MRFFSSTCCHVPRNVAVYGVFCFVLWIYCTYFYSDGWLSLQLPANYFSHYIHYEIKDTGNEVGNTVEWVEVTKVPEIVSMMAGQVWTTNAPEIGNFRHPKIFISA